MWEILIYIVKCIIALLITWTGVRLIGRKSISEMTSYDLAGLLLMSTVAAEPLVYKVVSKSALGVGVLASGSIIIGLLSLHRRLYNIDMSPILVIVNGKIDYAELKKSKMNLPLLLSQLRVMGYYNIQDIEFAVLEPMGKISVIPKSQTRPVTPQDLQLSTQYEGMPLPLIIDGVVQDRNIRYAKLDRKWLRDQLMGMNISDTKHVLFAQIDTTGKLYVSTYYDIQKDELPPGY